MYVSKMTNVSCVDERVLHHVCLRAATQRWKKEGLFQQKSQIIVRHGVDSRESQKAQFHVYASKNCPDPRWQTYPVYANVCCPTPPSALAEACSCLTVFSLGSVDSHPSKLRGAINFEDARKSRETTQSRHRNRRYSNVKDALDACNGWNKHLESVTIG